MLTEKFFIVDKDDKPIPNLLVDKEYLHTVGGMHRAIHLLIEVFGGQFVIQKKAEHTENGGKWSSAVSGHVRAEETYEQAAVREAKEELGLTISEKDLQKIAKIHPSADTGNEFVTVFSYLMDPSKERIELLSDEVDEVIICSMRDLMDDLDNNRRAYSPAFIRAFNVLITMARGSED